MSGVTRSRQAIAFGLALIVCCLIVIAFVVSSQLTRLNFDEQLIHRNQTLITSLETVQGLLHETEMTHLSSLMSDREVDHQPFVHASQRLTDELDTLRALLDNQQQVRRLSACSGLLHQYHDFLDYVVSVRRRDGLHAARQLVWATSEAQPKLEMRSLMADIIGEARGHVLRRRDQRLSEAHSAQRLILISLLLTAIGGLVVLHQLRHEVRQRRESEAAVRLTLREVDDRVTARTEELSRANAQLEEALTARAQALTTAQQARASAEHANELKDRFLATISHELRTPLNAIVGWVYVLKTGRLGAHDSERAIESIGRNARVQARLITDLLDVSRMIQGRLVFERVPMDLRPAVDAAIDSCREGFSAKHLVLSYHGSSAVVPVHGDAARLQQVVDNLLSNALKFTPQGGRVDVTLTVDGNYAQLRVRDSGEGIAPDTLPQLFDPFFQGRTAAMRTGLGLGLPLVREFLALHGGTVAVESDGVGQGTLVTVRLPLLRPADPVGDRRSLTPEPDAEPTAFWRRLLRRRRGDESADES